MRFNLEYDNENSLKVLGLLVKYHRTLNEFSLRDLGYLSNISHTLISNVEKGKVVSNDDTLKDLFKVLKIQFLNKEEIFFKFKPIYETLMTHLYNYEYEKAKFVFEEMVKNQKEFANSSVLIDYHLIKYLYLSLMDEMYGVNEEEYLRLRDIAQNLTPKQTQLLHLVHGIYLITKGRFLESSLECEKAVKIGDSRLDAFINIFLMRSYVKMYRFMDAQRLSRESIPKFEADLNYSRAMEIRIIISYSYILVRKYKEATDLLDKVYRFANFYNAPYLLDECNLNYGIIHIGKKELDLAKMKFRDIKNNVPVVLLQRALISIMEGDFEKTTKTYYEFVEYNKSKPNRRFEFAFEVIAASLQIATYDEDTYLKKLEEYAEFGIEGCNLEVIEIAYGLLIDFYTNKRMYKKAFEASEIARQYRRFGCGK